MLKLTCKIRNIQRAFKIIINRDLLDKMLRLLYCLLFPVRALKKIEIHDRWEEGSLILEIWAGGVSKMFAIRRGGGVYFFWSNPFSISTNCHFNFWPSFFLNFLFQRSSLSMKLSFISDSYVKSGTFATILLSLLTFLLLVLKGQTRCPKTYDNHRDLCTRQIYDFNFQELLVYLEFRLSSWSTMSFYLPCCWALQKPITRIEFKYVVRQVNEASVAIRATKPKFVAESRTRVYFAQHVPSTCNIEFCCETSWSQKW